MSGRTVVRVNFDDATRDRLMALDDDDATLIRDGYEPSDAVVEAVAGELMAIRRAAPDSHAVTLARAAITATFAALAQGAK